VLSTTSGVVEYSISAPRTKHRRAEILSDDISVVAISPYTDRNSIKMDWITPSNSYNIVRDWNKVQGMTHPSDETAQIRRDINTRRISVENSSERTISVAIVPYYQGPLPIAQATLVGGRIINVGVNLPDGPMQYIHVLDPKTRKPVGAPYALRHDANSFVLRDGVNKWWVQAFQATGFKG